MARAISNKNVLSAKFDTIDFDGEWLATIGRPELTGSWIVWGSSGSGKTTFTLALCKYLSRFKRVAYNSLEQGLSLSFQKQWERAKMLEAGASVILLDKESMSDLKERLKKRRAPEVVIIDSMMCLVGFSRKEYISLMFDNPTTLFIFIAHEKNGTPDPPIAEAVRRLSDVKIHVTGFTAYPITRYEVSELGEGGAEYMIWEQGAKQYKSKLAELELNK